MQKGWEWNWDQVCVCLRLYLPYLPHNASNRAPGCWTLTASQGSANTNKLYKVFVAAASDVRWYSLEDKAVVSYSLLYDSTFTLPT